MYKFYLYHQDVGRYTRIKDPVGWDSLGKVIKRDLKWHGIFFDYAPKLRFVKDGRAFIQFYYEKYGIETEILLRIEKLDTLTRQYQVDYVGRLNLTSYKVGTTTVDVNVENTGFLQKLKNRQDIKIDLGSLVSQGNGAIPAFGNEFRNVTLHSRAIQNQFIRTQALDLVSGFYPSLSIPAGQTGNQYILLDIDNATKDEIKDRQPYGQQINNIDPVSALKYVFKCAVAGDYTFTFNINNGYNSLGTLATGSTLAWFLKHGRIGNYTSHQIGSTFNILGDAIVPINFTATITVSLAVDDEIYIYGLINITPGVLGWAGFVWKEDFSNGSPTSITITALTKAPTSVCKFQLIHEVWARMLQSITDTKDPLRSAFYGRTDSEPFAYGSDGDGSLKGITNGNQARLIDKPIYVSFKDLFETCRAIDGIGVGIEKSNNNERLRVEPITYFYQAKRLMQLSFVKDIQKEVAIDLYYNQLEGGLDKWTNDKQTNQDEFTGLRNWALPITQIKESLQLKSPYIYSGSSLEVTRRKAGDTSKDTETDNENFIVQLRRNSGNFDPDRNQDFTSVSGIIDPASAYNLKLSPVRNIKRNGRFLRSFLDKYQASKIRLNLKEGNAGLSSQLATETSSVVEGADINISSLDKPLFLAEYYMFKADLTRQQLIDLQVTDPSADKNVWQYIEFSYNDSDWLRGYLVEAKPNPANNECEFKLLRANV